MVAIQPNAVALPNREPWIRAERLYKLKCMFAEGGEYSSAELAELFDVTTDTVYRDLQILSTKMCIPLVRTVRVEVRWRMMEKEEDT